MIIRTLATAVVTATILAVALTDPEPPAPRQICEHGTSPFANSKVDFVVAGEIMGETVSRPDGTWTICWTER